MRSSIAAIAALGKILQERLFANPKVEVLWNHVMEDIIGDDNPPSVTGAKLRNVRTDEVSERAFDGVSSPSDMTRQPPFKGHVGPDDEGYVLTKPDSTATAIPGVFAAGDVKDKIYRQAVTAAGMGCMAALEAEKFVAEHEVHSEAAE